MIPEIKKSLYPNGISGNDLLKLKDSFTPTELQEMVQDPFAPSAKITLQALLQKLENNTPAYVTWLGSKDTRDAHLQKLEQILYHGTYTISTPNDPVLLAALKKYALSIIPKDNKDTSLQQHVDTALDYRSIFLTINSICTRSQQSFPWGNRYEDLVKLFPTGDLYHLGNLKIILQSADPSLDILDIEGTKYTISGGLQYYARIGTEIKKLKAENAQMQIPFEYPLVNTPALMAVLKRQSQAYRVKLAIKDNLRNLRVNVQAMKANPSLKAPIQARNQPKKEAIAAAKAEAARISAQAEAARQAEEAAEAARKTAEEDSRQAAARAESARKAAEEAAAAEAAATAATHQAAARAEAERKAAEAAAAEAARRAEAEEAAARKAAENLKEARYRQFVDENDQTFMWSILAAAGHAGPRPLFTQAETAEFQLRMQQELANRPTRAPIQYDEDLSDDDISAV